MMFILAIAYIAFVSLGVCFLVDRREPLLSILGFIAYPVLIGGIAYGFLRVLF